LPSNKRGSGADVLITKVATLSVHAFEGHCEEFVTMGRLYGHPVTGGGGGGRMGKLHHSYPVLQALNTIQIPSVTSITIFKATKWAISHAISRGLKGWMVLIFKRPTV
jgi:hypothetical protein